MADFFYYLMVFIFIILPAFAILLTLIGPKVGAKIHKNKMNKDVAYKEKYLDEIKKSDIERKVREAEIKKKKHRDYDDDLPF